MSPSIDPVESGLHAPVLPGLRFATAGPGSASDNAPLRPPLPLLAASPGFPLVAPSANRKVSAPQQRRIGHVAIAASVVFGTTSEISQSADPSLRLPPLQDRSPSDERREGALVLVLQVPAHSDARPSANSMRDCGGRDYSRRRANGLL